MSRRLALVLGVPLLAANGPCNDQLTVGLQNDDVDPIHFLAPDMDFDRSNQVPVDGELAHTVFPDKGTTTHTFSVGRSETIFATVDCVVTFDEGENSTKLGAELVWDGFSLSACEIDE